jgi:hypothetical protein
MTHMAAEVIAQHAQLVDDWRHPRLTLTRYIEAFAEDARRRRGSSIVNTMFYPLFSDPARDFERWVRLVGKDLFSACTFQVTTEMCRAVTAIYQKSTEKTTRISVAELPTVGDDLPAESGFAWLDEPPAMIDRRGKVTRDRAVSWCVTAVPNTINGDTCTGLRVILWADITVDDDYTAEWRPGIKNRSEREIGRLQLQHCYALPLDTDLTWSSDHVPTADNSIAWLHAMFMLLGTEIPATHRAIIPASVQGSVKRRVKHPAVTVVTLRRVAARPDDPGTEHHREVDWRYRWVVQGHHRHIESYEGQSHHATPTLSDRGTCAVCQARITWIRPHIKGADDLPMKPSSGHVVYRLRR